MAKRRSFGYVRKLPSGNYQASYVGPDENRYTAARTYRATAQATNCLTLIQASIISGGWEASNVGVSNCLWSADS